MPIHKTKGGFQWGNHGKVYPTREGAEKQAAAAHANGYRGDVTSENYDAAEATMEYMEGQCGPVIPESGVPDTAVDMDWDLMDFDNGL